MPVDITIPSPGESITEVVLGSWLKGSGDWIEKDEPLVEVESDKVTLEVPAPETGLLSVIADSGAEMHVGDVIGRIDPSAPKPRGDNGAAERTAPVEERAAAANEAATETASAAASSAAASDARATSLAKKVAADKGVSLESVQGTGVSGRITKQDVLAAVATPASEAAPAAASSVPARVEPSVISTAAASRGVRREKMSKLRQRIAERLVQAQHQAAMLTTFNEVDMTEILRLRREHKEAFMEKHGVSLGFMSFFTKACVSALRVYEGINAYIDADEVEYHDYVDVSIAVGTPKGLVVPVIRDAHLMSFAGIEKTIQDLAVRARNGKLTMEDMTGGTFTLTNGGVFGSLNSTPILNPPQSGILGMHKIQNRPVEDPGKPGQIALRPMMYLALSYDHRIVDGEQAVRFLVHVKERLENPERLMLDL